MSGPESRFLIHEAQLPRIVYDRERNIYLAYAIAVILRFLSFLAN